MTEEEIKKLGEVEVVGNKLEYPIPLARKVVHLYFGRIPKKKRIFKKKLQQATNELLREYIKDIKRVTKESNE